MEINEYFNGLNEYTSIRFSIDDTKLAIIHLISPTKKKANHYFTIVFNGSFFARLESFDGVIFNELFKKIKEERMKNILTDKLTEYIRDSIIFTIELFQNGEIDLEDKTNYFVSLFQEIKRISLGNKLKNVFDRIEPYVYSRHHKCPYRITFLEGNISDRAVMLSNLDRLYNNGVFYIEYDESFIISKEIKNYLKATDYFYNSLIINKYIISNKEAIELYAAGLSQIVINVNSKKSETEYMLSGRSIKDINSTIKACIHAGIKVIVNTNISNRNTDYLPLLEYYHSLGVKSFSISIDMDVEQADLIVKRANYYTTISSLELFLNTNSVKPNQIRNLNVITSYKDKYITTFYMKQDNNIYLDNECNILLGNINNSLQECYLNKIAKKKRLEYLKELK